MDATSIEEFDRKIVFLRSDFLIEKDKNQLQLAQLIGKMSSSSDSRCMKIASEYLNAGYRGVALSIWTTFPTLYDRKTIVFREMLNIKTESLDFS